MGACEKLVCVVRACKGPACGVLCPDATLCGRPWCDPSPVTAVSSAPRSAAAPLAFAEACGAAKHEVASEPRATRATRLREPPGTAAHLVMHRPIHCCRRFLRCLPRLDGGSPQLRHVRLRRPHSVDRHKLPRGLPIHVLHVPQRPLGDRIKKSEGAGFSGHSDNTTGSEGRVCAGKPSGGGVPALSAGLPPPAAQTLLRSAARCCRRRPTPARVGPVGPARALGSGISLWAARALRVACLQMRPGIEKQLESRTVAMRLEGWRG